VSPTPPTLWSRVRPGVWAGGTVGLLTSLCYILFFGGLDFSRGNPLRALLDLPPRMLVLSGIMTFLGAIAGAVVSLKTPDDPPDEPHAPTPP
jgi:hypothetical protein